MTNEAIDAVSSVIELFDDDDDAGGIRESEQIVERRTSDPSEERKQNFLLRLAELNDPQTCTGNKKESFQSVADLTVSIASSLRNGWESLIRDKKSGNLNENAAQLSLIADDVSMDVKDLFREVRTGITAASVCYKNFGCFSNCPPFDNSLGFLPENPANTKTKFLLYTRKNKKRPLRLRYDRQNTVNRTRFRELFNPNLDTKIIIHGFKESRHKPWVKDVTREMLRKENVNVIVVDWSRGARGKNYFRAVANTRIVGAETAWIMQLIESYMRVRPSTFHLIGFSLGAHVAGTAGELTPGLSRITGLDPAGPMFEEEAARVRLDAGDAQLVEILHFNGGNMFLGFLGIQAQQGDIDFYINGGSVQPGCNPPAEEAVKSFATGKFDEIFDRASCSHERGHDFFVEFVKNRQNGCKFTAFSCRNYNLFRNGKCLSAAKMIDTQRIGEARVRGAAYMETSPMKPYCVHMNKISLAFQKGSPLPNGVIRITFGQDNVSVVLRHRISGRSHGRNDAAGFTMQKLFNTPTSPDGPLRLTYNARSSARRHEPLVLEHVYVKDGFTQSRLQSCRQKFIRSGESKTIHIGATCD